MGLLRSHLAPSASSAGVRTEQDLYVRLIDSVTKQVSLAGQSAPPLAGPRLFSPAPSSLPLTSPTTHYFLGPFSQLFHINSHLIYVGKKIFFPSQSRQLSLHLVLFSGWGDAGDVGRRAKGRRREAIIGRF